MPLTAAHSETYFELSQNPGFLLYQISNYKRSSVQDANQWIQAQESYRERNGFGIIAAFEKSEERLLGLVALKYLGEEKHSAVELMYRFADTSWGKGYGYEAGRALADHAFHSLRLNTIVAAVNPANLTSKRVLMKIGFKFSKMIKLGALDEELHTLNRHT